MGCRGLAVLEFNCVLLGFGLQKCPRSLGCWESQAGEERGLCEVGEMYSSSSSRGNWLKSVSQASGKGEGGCHPLSSCSPSGCCSELPFAMCPELTREQRPSVICLAPALPLPGKWL